MRHNVSILLGKEMERFAPLLAKYIYKYGEGDVADYFQAKSWIKDSDGNIEIQKAELINTESGDFVSTTKNMYSCQMVEDKTLGAEKSDALKHTYFTNLHQSTVTINRPGDSNRLLLTIFTPLYDKDCHQEVVSILKSLADLQNGYEVVVIGFASDIRHIISSSNETDEVSLETESILQRQQKEALEQLAEIRLQNNRLAQIIVLQNINKSGFALNLEEDSLIRIIGEIALISIEKYDTIFHPATLLDPERPYCSLGLSVLNLDKYYFSNYLLRRSYLHILQREGVEIEEVPINKVAVDANSCLANHQHIYTNFYKAHILPLVQKRIPHDEIVAQTADLLKRQLKEIEKSLTNFISDDKYMLPEKQAMLALILGYDDPFLVGNIFNQQQLSIDSLDEDVANVFIIENNKQVKKYISEDGEECVEKGPIKECCDIEGKAKLPLQELQELRNLMRQSTNYIRQKSGELEQLEVMTQHAFQSEKRLTESGFEVDGNIYYLEKTHEEVKFEDTYVPKVIKEESSIDLRDEFTQIKNQGQMGACTVFAATSIFEYILKKNAQKNPGLSEAFVYYNIRKTKGKEDEDTGSSYQDVIKSMGTDGICLEELHPYTEDLTAVPNQEAYDDAKHRRILKALNVDIDINSIKSAIHEGYPVAISLKVFDSFSTTINSGQGSNVQSNGFVSYPTNEELASTDFGYHAMVIVGYSDETKYFVVRNSWGENFGDKGYCYIPYSYIGNADLNRMACIITEVEVDEEQAKIVVGNSSGQKTIVHFNLNDSIIKGFVIKNLIKEEELNLKKMKDDYFNLKVDYDSLMQRLGQQSKRNAILTSAQETLRNEIESAKSRQNKINTEERPYTLKEFRKEKWKTRITLIILTTLFFLVWIVGFFYYQNNSPESNRVTDFFLGAWAWITSGWGIVATLVLVVTALITILYWWWSNSRKRQLEMELEESSAQQARRVKELTITLEELPLKFQIAGMIIDDLLKLRILLDKKYQVMKSYIGNLKVWQQEEKQSIENMESLVKNPFIPLLKNEVLDKFFKEEKEKITDRLRLCEFLENYGLNDAEIVKFKRSIKDKILSIITKQLQDFTVLQHILGIKNYPYLDTEYASAQKLFPILDQKSDIFCQIKSSIEDSQEACFLFVNMDDQDEDLWNKEYPRHFFTKSLSENIKSRYKILILRMQLLSIKNFRW